MRIDPNVCESFQRAPGNTKAGDHSGVLVDHNTTNGVIRVCAKCKPELVELQAFLNRTEIEPHASVMHVPPKEPIRIFRTAHYDVPLLHPLQLDDDTRRKMPKLAYSEPGIVVLHGTMLQTALRFDGVEQETLASNLHIERRKLKAFLNCEGNMRDAEFAKFLDWVVENKYAMNHLLRRADARAIIADDESLRKVKRYSAAEKESMRNKVWLYVVTNQGTTNRKLAARIGVGKNTANRVLNSWMSDELSDAVWAKVEKWLREGGLF